MPGPRLTTASRDSLYFSAGALLLYAVLCALLGWYVGGRPAGWFEGKHLVGPVYAAALVSTAVAVIAMLGALMGLRQRYASEGSLRGTDLLPLAVALGACCWLVSNLWQPWGLAEVYAIARWRQSLWVH
jgi:hypothetical protein